MTVQDRETLLVSQYGEVCSKATAAKILSKSTQTVRVMLEDGRLDTACAGTAVDVRSIARYIMAPKTEDRRARNLKLQRRWTV